MKGKKLDEQSIVNELTGNSLFFQERNASPSPVPENEPPKDRRMPLESPPSSPKAISIVPNQTSAETRSEKVRNHDVPNGKKFRDETMVSRPHDTTIPRYPDTKIEMIRKAVKQFGKEAATHRFTPEEKKLLRDIVYTYESDGIKTSENEVARIAIHYLIDDYHENGENSVLVRVLARLNA